ncbi:1-phosphatidylinositol 4,5-bisphosphate phosphodiesterase beta-1-like, partial [Salvelinus alpinus]
YAEALTNPMKHYSLLVQRDIQLASLMEDNSESVFEQPKEGGRDLEGDAPLVKIPSPLHPVPAPVDDIVDFTSSPGPGQKEDLIAIVLTNLQAQSIEELKQQKSYLKLLKNQGKELRELRKKHLKKVWSLSKEQKTRFSQLHSDTQKQRSQMEKHLKSSMKKNQSAEPVQRQLTALEVELQKQTVQLREWQMDELLKLRQQQHSLERKKRHTHLRELSQKLEETAQECQPAQLKKLKDICAREKKELQKILDRKRQNSILEAKSEQNEINRKHISDSVTLIRRLEEAQLRRQEKLVIGQREVLRHIEEENPLLKARLEQDFVTELQRLPEEICQYLQTVLESKGLCSDALFSLSNHSSPSSSSGTPSNCSTPTLPLTPNSSAWNRSLDNGIASVVDSSSSSTPVQSDVELTMV